MVILNRVPKYCHIGRAYGTDGVEAKRQLKIWRKSPNIASDWSVHLYHAKTRGWAIVMCSPDYKNNHLKFKRR